MYEIKSRVLKSEPTLVMRNRLALSAVGEWLCRAYETTAKVAGDRIAGPPFARFHIVKKNPVEFEIEAGFPVESEATGSGEVVSSSLPGGLAAGASHLGSYGSLEPTYLAVQDWLEEHGALPDGDPWEVYYSDPTEDPDVASWRTELVQPYTA